MVAIPAHQLWAWRPEAQAAIAKASQEVQEGKGISLDSPEGEAFLRKLSEA
jgi:hypothetical protein